MDSPRACAKCILSCIAAAWVEGLLQWQGWRRLKGGCVLVAVTVLELGVLVAVPSTAEAAEAGEHSRV